MLKFSLLKISILVCAYLIICFKVSAQVNYYDVLKTELAIQLDSVPEEPYIVLMVSELNCNACFDFIANLPDLTVFGFMLSKQPANFQKRLQKLNQEIHWLTFDNEENQKIFTDKFKLHNSPLYLIVANSQLNVNQIK